MITDLTANAGEIATRQNLAISLDGDTIDSTIRIRVERISQPGRPVEPRNIIARLSTNCIERTSGQDTPRPFAAPLH